MIYLDHAASSFPKPKQVIRAVCQNLERNTANPGRSGHRMSLQAAEAVYQVRQRLADFFGTQPELVLFCANATDAINKAFKGLLNPGDHVIISDLEHNAVLRPLNELKKQGVDVSIVVTEPEENRTIGNVLRLIRPQTRLVFCTHASNVTGRVLPLYRLGKECRARGILFGADVSQSAGHLPCRLEDLSADFLCCPGHKGLLGPQGTGCLVLIRPLEMKSLIQGGTGGDSLLETQPEFYPEGYESGTLNTPGILGLGEGVRFVQMHGEQLRRQGEALYQDAYRKLKEIRGIQLYSPEHCGVPVLSFSFRNFPSEEVTAFLDRNGICVRGGFHCAALTHRKLNTDRHGLVRASFGFGNRAEDVQKLAYCLKNY